MRACSRLGLAILLCSLKAAATVAAPIISNLFLDLNGDNLGNFVFSSGSSISTWLDQAPLSGSQDYSQGTSTKQPTVASVVTPNGTTHNVVNFVRGTPTNNTNSSTATSQFLSNGGGSAYESATGTSFFIVFKNRLGAQPTVSARQRVVIYQDRNSSAADVLGLQTSETNAVGPNTLIPDLFVQLRDPDTNGMSNAEIVGDIRTDIWYAVGMSWDYASGTATTRYLYSDGTVFNTTQVGAPWPTGLPSGRVTSSLIGALSSSNTGGQAFDGQIAEVLRYDAALGAADFNATMDYLNTKYFIVPEPWSIVLVSLTGIGLAAMNRRRL